MDQNEICKPVDGYLSPLGRPEIGVTVLEWRDARRMALRAPLLPVLAIYEGRHLLPPDAYTATDGEIVLAHPPAFTVTAVVDLR